MDIKSNLIEKAGITALASTVAAALGWKGIMAVVWVVAMALDYLSGTLAACRTGQWSSTTAREGLWHKGGMIMVVSVAGIADIILDVVCSHIPDVNVSWPGAVLPLVLAWYILTELGSVLENAVKMGASAPSWLIKLLKAGAAAVETAGDASITTEQDNESES